MSTEHYTLAEIVGPWEESAFESGLVDRLRAAWTKPIQNLTKHELATCLRQRFAIDDVLPVAKKRVSHHIDDGPKLDDAELIEAIQDAEHWCFADEEDRRVRGLPVRGKKLTPSSGSVSEKPTKGSG